MESVQPETNNTTNNKSNRVELNSNRKMANEPGIAGFVFASIMSVSDQFATVKMKFDMFGNWPLSADNINTIIVLVLLLTSFVLSIKGVSKNGQLYQKGLAATGLALNIYMIIFFIVQVFYLGSSSGTGAEMSGQGFQ